MPINWKEPPPPRRGSGERVFSEDDIAELMANPGKWATYEYDHKGRATQISNAIKKGRQAGLTGRWEATARSKKDEGGSELYLRYMGPADENSDEPA